MSDVEFEKWVEDSAADGVTVRDVLMNRYPMQAARAGFTQGFDMRQPEIDALKAALGLCEGTLDSRDRNIESMLSVMAGLRAENERLREELFQLKPHPCLHGLLLNSAVQEKP